MNDHLAVTDEFKKRKKKEFGKVNWSLLLNKSLSAIQSIFITAAESNPVLVTQ